MVEYVYAYCNKCALIRLYYMHACDPAWIATGRPTILYSKIDVDEKSRSIVYFLSAGNFLAAIAASIDKQIYDLLYIHFPALWKTYPAIDHSQWPTVLYMPDVL